MSLRIRLPFVHIGGLSYIYYHKRDAKLKMADNAPRRQQQRRRRYNFTKAAALWRAVARGVGCGMVDGVAAWQWHDLEWGY